MLNNTSLCELEMSLTTLILLSCLINYLFNNNKSSNMKQAGLHLNSTTMTFNNRYRPAEKS